MMRTHIQMFAGLAATAALSMVPAAATAQPTTAAQRAHYSATDTLVGKLLDDPAAWKSSRSSFLRSTRTRCSSRRGVS
jgi:hypothetical protein